MDIRRECFHCWKTYFFIGAYITPLHRHHKESIIDISAKQPPVDGFLNKHDGILLQFVHELHCDPFLHPSNHASSDKEVDS